jgi:tetratricopeptide (TPR) repeat protein
MGCFPHLEYRSCRAIAAFACLLAASAAGAAENARGEYSGMHGGHGAQAGEEPLGAVDFRGSCDEAIQPAFDRALGFMHHMMYEQAREAFERVVEADPQCAMAHWGIATTLFQPLWPTRPSADDLQRGWTEIQKAKELEPATGRERNLVEATEAFFREPETADWRTRIERWAEAIEVAHRAAPEDPDTAAFYALSRLALAPWAEDRQPLHAEAESMLRGVYDQVPTHPGAIHYTIHANDAADRADKSLEIVKSYG